MDPWPQAWTYINLKTDKDSNQLRLKILKAHVDEGKLILDEVQLEGKNPVSWTEFQKGYPNFNFTDN